MTTTSSKALLLENDQLDTSFEDNGFSSGYDSIEQCDSDSSSGDNRHIEASSDSESEDDSNREVMTFRSTGILYGQLAYILSMPELCDVAFLVGPRQVPVYGVKAILGTRSRVFYQLILDRQHETDRSNNKKNRKAHQNGKLTISVTKYEPEDFQKIIQFIHCGTVEVNIHNVAGLLCGAYQFELEDLRIACWDFVRRTFKTDSSSVRILLNSASRYIQHRAGFKLISKIHKHVEHMRRKHKHPVARVISTTV